MQKVGIFKSEIRSCEDTIWVKKTGQQKIVRFRHPPILNQAYTCFWIVGIGRPYLGKQLLIFDLKFWNKSQKGQILFAKPDVYYPWGDNVVPFQNGGQITNFCFASFRFWPNFEKPLSQRNFSMKFGSKKENLNIFTLLK